MSQISVYHYTWDMFDKDLKSIVTCVDFSKYDYLVGIAAGGLPILTKLVNATGLPYGVVSCKSYDGVKRRELNLGSIELDVKAKRILLIDDVADSGATLVQLITDIQYYYQQHGKKEIEIELLTLCYKQQSTIVPTWYSREIPNEQWIIFPWE